MHWKSLIRTRVVVNLVTGTAVYGILLRQKGPLLFLTDCQVSHAAGEPTSADGQIVVERSQVEFIQVVG